MMKVELGIHRVVIEAPCEGGTFELKPKFRRSWSYKAQAKHLRQREKPLQRP